MNENLNQTSLQGLLAIFESFLQRLKNENAIEAIQKMEILIQEAKMLEKERLLQEGIHFTQQSFFYDAEAPLNAAAKLDPFCPRIREAQKAYLLGLARREKEKKWYSEAATAYEKALALFPDSGEIKKEYYFFKAFLEKYFLTHTFHGISEEQKQVSRRKIITWYKRVLDEIDPNNIEVLLKVADLLLRLSDVSANEKKLAEELLAKVIVLEPKNVAPWEIKQKYYLRKQKIGAERDICEAILARKPDEKMKRRLHKLEREVQRNSSNSFFQGRQGEKREREPAPPSSASKASDKKPKP